VIYNRIHGRRSIRLKNYDYSKEGIYFITICTQNREMLFGEIIDKKMKLNEVGEMIKSFYLNLENRYENIKCHEYVIMPNHIHFIIEILGKEESMAPMGGASTKLGDIIGSFKSLTTVKYIENVKLKKWKSFDRRIWQKNYYEHIIRDEKDYERISNYINNNPINWNEDKFRV